MLASETRSAAVLLINGFLGLGGGSAAAEKMKSADLMVGSPSLPERYAGPGSRGPGRLRARRPGCAPAAAAVGPPRGPVAPPPCSPDGARAGGPGRPSTAAG